MLFESVTSNSEIPARIKKYKACVEGARPLVFSNAHNAPPNDIVITLRDKKIAFSTPYYNEKTGELCLLIKHKKNKRIRFNFFKMAHDDTWLKNVNAILSLCEKAELLYVPYDDDVLKNAPVVMGLLIGTKNKAFISELMALSEEALIISDEKAKSINTAESASPS